jgi:hypothetical protein
MSCPDWRALSDVHDDQAGWDDAVAHFDGGCQRCRRDALASDPTLVFRRLRPVDMSPAQESSEVDAVRQAVAAMRTASRVDSIESRSRHGVSWKRWAAAACLAFAALSIPGDDVLRVTTPAPPAAVPAALRAASAVLPAAFSGDDLPTVEGVNRPGARVYHMDGEGMSVVMIVDESLDV